MYCTSTSLQFIFQHFINSITKNYCGWLLQSSLRLCVDFFPFISIILLTKKRMSSICLSNYEFRIVLYNDNEQIDCVCSRDIQFWMLRISFFIINLYILYLYIVYTIREHIAMSCLSSASWAFQIIYVNKFFLHFAHNFFIHNNKIWKSSDDMKSTLTNKQYACYV